MWPMSLLFNCTLFYSYESNLFLYFSHEHIEILANAAGEPLMFRHRDGPYMPTLKLLHKCEWNVIHVYVIKG